MKKAVSAFFAVCVIGTMLFALAGQAFGKPADSVLFVNDDNMFASPGEQGDSIYFDVENKTLYLTDATISNGTFVERAGVYGKTGIWAAGFDLTIVLEGTNTILVQDDGGILGDSVGIVFESTRTLVPNEEILPAGVKVDPHTLTIKNASPSASLDITAVYNGLFADGNIIIDGAKVTIDSSDAVFSYYDIDIINDANVDARGDYSSDDNFSSALLLALGVITVDNSTLVGHASNGNEESFCFYGLVSSPSWFIEWSVDEAESRGGALPAAELDPAYAPDYSGAENGGIIIKNSNVTITADAPDESIAIYSEGDISIDKSTVSCLATSNDFTLAIEANAFYADDNIAYDLTVTDSTLIAEAAQGAYVSGDITITNSKVTANGSCGTGMYAAGDIYANGLSTIVGASLDALKYSEMQPEAIQPLFATPGIAALGTINVNLNKGGLISGTGSTGLWCPDLLTFMYQDFSDIIPLEMESSSLEPANDDLSSIFGYSFAPGIVAGDGIVVAKTNEVTFPAKGKIGTLSVTEPRPATNTLVLLDDGSIAQEAQIAAASLPLTGDASVMWLVALLVVAALGAAGAVARKVYVRTHK